MRIARHGPPGMERPIISRAGGGWYDLTPMTPDITPDFLQDGLDLARAALAAGRLPAVQPSARFGPPLRRPGKVVCVGLNYRDHAEETGAALPGEPIIFMKAPDTVVGPDDDVLIPRGSAKTDWEVELAVVIGRTARYLDSEAEALACIAGYAISHDVSEREFQLERGGQWDKGKSCETFNPFGPWITTADAVGDPQALSLRLSVNGTVRQHGSTANMIFSVVAIVRYLSQFMVLYPGDVINTGTPAGVALGAPEPKPYLRPGDIVDIEIDGLGQQRQLIREA
jgi:2-keto-4-pentenoate hydratase/2-oxohepta-3-ene-1,7-dioic acid hydratase in catechol pathway